MKNLNLKQAYGFVLKNVKKNTKLTETSKCIKGKTFVIAGGKYTTFRVMGQSITKNIVTKAGGKYSSKRSLTPLQSHSVIKNNQKWGDGGIQEVVEKIYQIILVAKFKNTLCHLLYCSDGAATPGSYM